MTIYKQPDIRNPRMSTTQNNLRLKSHTPVRSAVFCAITLLGAGSAYAAPITCYTPPDGVLRTPRQCVNPSDIPNFVTPLPSLGAMTATPKNTGLIPDTLGFNVTLTPGTQQMLPATTATGAATTFKPSTIWGYADGMNPPHAPGAAIVVTKNTPTEVTYNNQLPVTHPLAISQDWGLMSSMAFTSGFTDPVLGGIFGPGPGKGLDNRVAVHNHGLAATALSDGAAWDIFPAAGGNYVNALQTTYTYPNSQNGSLYWFHDHAIGQTRLNAYMGLAAPYIIRDPAHVIDKMLMPTTSATGVVTPPALSSAYELPLVIQDRDFTDVISTPGFNEQYFEEAPAGPERFGSVWMVNGATTPFVNVKDHVYRLRLLNGSQARVATLQIHMITPQKQNLVWKPAMYVIGHEQGSDPTLSKQVNNITIAPGERLDLLLDFRLAGKQLPTNGSMKFILVNTAPAPYPGGAACIPAGAFGGPAAGTPLNSTGQPLASANQLNNCIPQPVWAFSRVSGLPTAAATPIAQVMQFNLTRDMVPNAAGTLVTAPATALDNFIVTPDKPFVAKALTAAQPSLLAQTLTKYCVGVPAGTVCDYQYLINTGKIKERVFSLYDLPFANLVLGDMALAANNLRYGVNIDNRHYEDPGSVNGGLPLEAVQNTMTTPAGSDIVEEVWTYINATPDAHPMHEHLFAMQALDREYYDALSYLNDSLGYPLLAPVGGLIPAPSANIDLLTGLPYPYHHPSAAVPGVQPGNPLQDAWAGYVGGVVNGVPGPGAIDFRNYIAKNSTGAPCGRYGNTVPAATATCITASTAAANNLTGAIVTSGNIATPQAPAPLAPEERNWKDVIVAMPGQITRVLVRTARPDGTSFSTMPAGLPAGSNNTALLFNPKVGTFPMHCHILEHEENDMMTSFEVQ